MGTKKTKKISKIGKAKAIVKKINNDLIDASFNAIETTVKTGEKWQKLTSKLLKKAEPLTKQQINMVVETAENIKDQLENSTDRLKTLVGYDPKMLEQAKKKVTEHPLVEKAEEMKDKIEKEVSSNKLVKKAEKMSAKLKKNITETIEDVKEKIEDYTEDIFDDVKEKKQTPKAKKTVAKKVVKKEATKKVEIVTTTVKDNLKVIKGIGPKMEETFNKLGITAYEQLAKMTIKDITSVLANAGVNTKIYDISGWKSEAKQLIKESIEAVQN